MSITEIETAITQLPAEEIGELMSWLERYHTQIWEKQIADDLESGRLDSLIAGAYASGEASPLTKGDIDEARRIVKERITARNSAT